MREVAGKVSMEEERNSDCIRVHTKITDEIKHVIWSFIDLSIPVGEKPGVARRKLDPYDAL